MIKKCIGCGIELQGENPNSNGYLPKSVLESDSKELLCQRCFKIKNYSEYTYVTSNKDNLNNIISQIKKNDL